MHKIACLGTSLLLSGCGTFSNLPDFPEVTQYAAKTIDKDGNQIARPGYYGVNNKTGARVYKQFDDPSMDGAQVLDAKDYLKSEDWVQQVINEAQKRCN